MDSANISNLDTYKIHSVPRTGLEPVRPVWPRDFKSLVSTNSTIKAAFVGAKLIQLVESRKQKTEKVRIKGIIYCLLNHFCSMKDRGKRREGQCETIKNMKDSGFQQTFPSVVSVVLFYAARATCSNGKFTYSF